MTTYDELQKEIEQSRKDFNFLQNSIVLALQDTATRAEAEQGSCEDPHRAAVLAGIRYACRDIAAKLYIQLKRPT